MKKKPIQRSMVFIFSMFFYALCGFNIFTNNLLVEGNKIKKLRILTRILFLENPPLVGFFNI